MMELSRLTVLILAELLIGLGLVTLVLISMAVIRRHKTYRAAQRLVERIRLDTAPKSERLRQRLSEGYGIQDEALEQTVHDLSRAEKQLYQNIINGFLKRDLGAFQQIDVDVDNLVLAYQGLEPAVGQPAAETVEGAAGGTSREEIERLQEDNQRLADELKVTMDTMARMISEYASMFSDEMAAPEDEAGSQDEPAATGDAARLPDELSGAAGARAGQDDAVSPEEWSQEAITDTSDGDRTALETEGLEDDPEMVATADDPAPDEVLEVADDFSELAVHAMSQTDDGEPEPEMAQEALVDDLEPVDIMPPDLEQEPAAEEAGPGSLEEEWAKLLEEEAQAAELEDPEDKAKPA